MLFYVLMVSLERNERVKEKTCSVVWFTSA